jgi:AAA15 family ATPase/GTPase
MYQNDLAGRLNPHRLGASLLIMRLMVRFLIGLIQNLEINKHNAQLIFTTHDTSVLDAELFRRDQIWFVEKEPEQASRLYPLSDFNPRKGEALEKGYLNGRYGALLFV